ncbi:MAG: hypothetical protein FJX62_06145 [Alphaproteobacteria bacterium]|nr:hypothetical protein [Alphaproteobacteria bacterium]
MNVFIVGAGIGLITATVAGYLWGVPKEGEASRVPNKWGLAVAFPNLLMAGAIVGIVLTIKGFYP